MKQGLRVEVYGARGGIAVGRWDMQRYGGDTSCFLVRAGEECILLDAGTGAANLRLWQPETMGKKRLQVLITHAHLDHIMGLPFMPALFDPEAEVTLFGERRAGLSLPEQVSLMMRPPLWPVGPEAFPAPTLWREIQAGDTFRLEGGVRVRTLRSNHPDQCTLYRLEYQGASVVYALDFEHGAESTPALAAFARGCDLLICDAQYTDSEYALGKRGWGHSTVDECVALAEMAGAKRTLLAHHAPSRTDRMLDALSKTLPSGVSFARQGEVLVL